MGNTGKVQEMVLLCSQSVASPMLSGMPKRRAITRTRDGWTVWDRWTDKEGKRNARYGRGMRWEARARDTRLRRYVFELFPDGAGQEAKAKEWARKKAGALAAGVASADRVPLSEVAETYLAELRARRPPVHMTTLRNMELTVEGLTEAGATELASKNFRARVGVWLDGLRLKLGRSGREEAATSTLRRYLTHARALVNHARESGRLLVDPLAGFEPYAPPEAPREVFTLEDLRALRRLDARSNPRWVWLMLMCYTGLRSAEAQALRWEDINWASRFLVVQKGKGTKRRTVYMMDELHALLSAIGGPDAKVARVGYVVERRPKLSCTWAGLRLVLRDAGIEPDRGTDEATGQPRRLSAHSCRHSYAALRLATGADSGDLRQALGHSADDLTAYYSSQRDVYRRQVQAEGWPVDRFMLDSATRAQAT